MVKINKLISIKIIIIHISYSIYINLLSTH